MVIQDVLKERGISQVFVAEKLNRTPKSFSDMLVKNQTFDVFDLKKISEVVGYNFFDSDIIKPKLDNSSNANHSPKEKRVKISVTLEVDDESAEKVILEKIFDKPTVKKLLG